MKNRRYCPYPVIHYNSSNLATVSNLQPVTSNVLYQTENTLYNPNLQNYYYCYLTDRNSVVSMPYASPGKLILRLYTSYLKEKKKPVIKKQRAGFQDKNKLIFDEKSINYFLLRIC